jgi:sn-glycerol 3-phosphate transport system substrate-binding protein
MTRRPRLVSLAAAGALLLAATACAGDDTAGPGGVDGDGDLPDCPLGAIDEAGDGPVEITFWHAMGQANERALEDLTDEFNGSQDDVVVRLVNQTSYTDVFTKVNAGLRSGDLPQLAQIEDTGLGLMADSGAVLPAQSCVDADDYDLSGHVERVVDYYTIQDVLWPMPFNVSNPVLYYDKALFRRAGLDPEDPPATFDEVREASQAIVDEGVAPVGFSFKTEAWFIEQWLAKSGSPYVDNSNGRDGRATSVTFDSEAGLDIFTWLDEMVDDGLAQPEEVGGFNNLFAIGNHQAAMTIDTSAALGTITEQLAKGWEGVEIGVGPMPGPEGEGSVLVGGAALYILDRSTPAEQEAAWRYAMFLNRADVQARWSAATGYVPIIEAAIDEKALIDRWAQQPYYRIAYDQLLEGARNDATAGPVIGDYLGVREAVQDAIAAMLTQGMSPEDAVAQAARDADAAIETYNSRVGG